MEDFRSKPYGNGRDMQIQSYNGGRSTSSGSHNLRYTSSYSYSVPQTQIGNNDVKFKKSKSIGSTSKILSFIDPELQRKKRVASYKVYTIEGKLKGSFRKSFRWIKDRYTQVIYG